MTSIAVVGLSDNPLRPSYGVSEYMQSAGYRIIPVNPRLSAPILGEQPYARLEDVPEDQRAALENEGKTENPPPPQQPVPEQPGKTETKQTR